MEAFETTRINMVKGQILPSKINNKYLINAITTIPRHMFIQPEKHGIAYIDSFLPIGDGRYILPPMVLAKMIEALAIKPNDSLLDIACGTGYSSAVLAGLCKKIVAVEANTSLSSKAHLNLNKLAVDNVIIINGALVEGHEEGAPYDAIFINGAVKEVPQSLFDQLDENGRLVTILNKTTNSGSIVVYKKINGKLESVDVFETNLPVIEDF